MRVRQRRSSIKIVSILVVAIVFGLGILLVENLSNRTVSAEGDSGRLITVYDRGEAFTFLSKAETVGEALEQEGFAIDSRDKVEPALSETLVATDYNVNIYRARPVVVIDGSTRQRVVTPHQTAESIAKDAGIELYPEDITVLGRSDDILGDGAGLQLKIQRAVLLSVNLFGKETLVRTQAMTVAQLLAEKGIVLSDSDRTHPSADTPVTQGMDVKVWREGKQTITVEEAVTFSIERIYDADRLASYREVRTKGVNGLRTVSYEIHIENGKEVSRKQIVSIVSKKPVAQVEVVGVMSSLTSPTENEAIAWDFFRSQGFTAEQTAGIMGNLAQEHKFSTTDVPGGLGIAQWLGNRRANLLSRPDPFNITTQLEFIMHEFKTTEGIAYRAVKAAKTVEAATVAFQNKYERCGLCMEDRRIQYAYSILARYR